MLKCYPSRTSPVRVLYNSGAHTLAEHCEFGVLRQLIRDWIVVGIRDAKLSESVQLDADLPLAKTMTRVRQSVAVKKQQPVLRGTEQAIRQVEAIQQIHSKRWKVAKDKTDTKTSECSAMQSLEGLSCPCRVKENSLVIVFKQLRKTVKAWIRYS